MYKLQLANIYDAIYHFVDYPQNAAYIRCAIDEKHGKVKTLLELACGTGKYLEILQRYYQVQGLDLSAEMLAKAAQRLPNVALHQASMEDFSLDQSFDVVLCMFRSIAFVKTREAFFTTVQTMSRHLNPGGILLIEPFFTPDNFWTDTVTLNEYEDEALKISWMYTSKKIDDYGRLDNHYLVGTPDDITHFTEVHELGLFSHQDYQQAFELAGLELIHDSTGPVGVGLYIGKKTQ